MLGKDLAYFFSGTTSPPAISASPCTSHPRRCPRDVKPKTAHTSLYLMANSPQAIHISEQEYTNAFGDDGWRNPSATPSTATQVPLPPAPNPRLLRSGRICGTNHPNLSPPL